MTGTQRVLYWGYLIFILLALIFLMVQSANANPARGLWQLFRTQPLWFKHFVLHTRQGSSMIRDLTGVHPDFLPAYANARKLPLDSTDLERLVPHLRERGDFEFPTDSGLLPPETVSAFRVWDQRIRMLDRVMDVEMEWAIQAQSYTGRVYRSVEQSARNGQSAASQFDSEIAAQVRLIQMRRGQIATDIRSSYSQDWIERQITTKLVENVEELEQIARLKELGGRIDRGAGEQAEFARLYKRAVGESLETTEQAFSKSGVTPAHKIRAAETQAKRRFEDAKAKTVKEVSAEIDGRIAVEVEERLAGLRADLEDLRARQHETAMSEQGGIGYAASAFARDIEAVDSLRTGLIDRITGLEWPRFVAASSRQQLGGNGRVVDLKAVRDAQAEVRRIAREVTGTSRTPLESCEVVDQNGELIIQAIFKRPLQAELPLFTTQGYRIEWDVQRTVAEAAGF